MPVVDAPPVTTLLAWPASTRPHRLDGLRRAAAELARRTSEPEAPGVRLPAAG